MCHRRIIPPTTPPPQKRAKSRYYHCILLEKYETNVPNYQIEIHYSVPTNTVNGNASNLYLIKSLFGITFEKLKSDFKKLKLTLLFGNFFF